MRTYKIIRIFQNGHNRWTIKTGLTLEQAREHCNDPETSSKTAKSLNAEQITRHHGPWFDAYYTEG